MLIILQDDHKAFRRQLEDKRPIVESNLLSGRQYVASEPPLSDTSDTEGLNNSIKLRFIELTKQFSQYLMLIHASYRPKIKIVNSLAV